MNEDNLKHSSSIVNAQIADSLGQLLENLNMADGIEGSQNNQTSDEETEDYTLQTEMEEMSAMGLPMAFGRPRNISAKSTKR